MILITGASSGIGRELALQYAERKCRFEQNYFIINIFLLNTNTKFRLFLAARSEEKLKEVSIHIFIGIN